MFPANLKRRVNDRGIGAYLALAFSGMSILLTVLLAEVLEVAAINEVKAGIGYSLAELAQQTSARLDHDMFERYREVSLLSKRKDIIASGADKNEQRDILEARQESYSRYAWIGITDDKGIVRAATKGMLEGADVSQRPWFRNALNGIYVGDVHEAKLLAKMLPAEGKEPLRFVDVAFPLVAVDGKPAGVIGVHLSWQWARDVEQSIFEPIAQRRKVDLFIIDKQGTVLLGPPAMQGKRVSPPAIGKAGQTEGYVVERWDDGRNYLVGYNVSSGYAPYPGLGWTVLVRQNVDDAFAPVKRIRERVLYWGIVLALVFSILGYLLSRRITRPLWGLARAAQQMQIGKVVSLPSMEGSYFEARALAGSLDALVTDLMQKKEALRELNQTLEHRVEQRTSELEQALTRVRANEQRIQAIIESAQDAYIAIDLEGRVYEWSRQAETIFGWEREEVLGKTLDALVLPARFRPSLRKTIALYRQTGTPPAGRMERIVVDRSGREFPVELTVSLGGARDGYFFGAFLRDISERKKIEKMKSEFISTVSHELRTPLTSIRGSLSMLVSGMAGELPPDIRELLEISHASCERLVRLVNDVLDVEKIASGGMTYHMDAQFLHPMLEQAIAAIEGYAAQYRVQVRLQDADPAVSARIDIDRMIQVMTNLLSNAIKFSPPESAVEVTLRSIDGQACIAVRDRGNGIPEEFHSRIFGKFAQADATDSRKKGGTGLGLSICKSIVEDHGGNIRFESQTGVGTVFYVSLPLASAQD
jgi:PAS domain S-box-containing protein